MQDGFLDPRIKLRHVTCFVEVARQHSVVRAAEALGMTQPGVSKTLKELEDTLGLALFDRSRRRRRGSRRSARCCSKRTR